MHLCLIVATQGSRVHNFIVDKWRLLTGIFNVTFFRMPALPFSAALPIDSLCISYGKMAFMLCRPATTGPIHMDGGSPTSRGYVRPYYYNHHPQQISQSRLGQQSGHFEQQQQQYPYQSLNVRSSEQLPIPFSITHPQLGHQFLTQSIHASAGHSLPYVLPGSTWSKQAVHMLLFYVPVTRLNEFSGNPAPAQGMHIHNQMSPIGPPHWASGFPG